jgi:tyrosyl-tRNA synthetase
LTLEKPWICSVLKDAGLIQSTSEGKRLIEQGAVKINDDKVTDEELVLLAGTYIIKVGKRRFAQVEIC